MSRCGAGPSRMEKEEPPELGSSWRAMDRMPRLLRGARWGAGGVGLSTAPHALLRAASAWPCHGPARPRQAAAASASSPQSSPLHTLLLPRPAPPHTHLCFTSGRTSSGTLRSATARCSGDMGAVRPLGMSAVWATKPRSTCRHKVLMHSGGLLRLKRAEERFCTGGGAGRADAAVAPADGGSAPGQPARSHHPPARPEHHARERSDLSCKVPARRSV